MEIAKVSACIFINIIDCSFNSKMIISSSVVYSATVTINIERIVYKEVLRILFIISWIFHVFVSTNIAQNVPVLNSITFCFQFWIWLGTYHYIELCYNFFGQWHLVHNLCHFYCHRTEDRSQLMEMNCQWFVCSQRWRIVLIPMLLASSM